MLPQFEFTENEKGELAATVAQEGDDFGPAMAKAFGDQFAEVFSEHTGGALAFVPGAEKLRLMKSALMQRWFQGHPEAAPGMFAELVRKAGWHGVVGEMFEERVGDATRAALGLQSWRDVIPSPQQLLVEAVSFGLPGAVGTAGHAIAGRGGHQGHAERTLPPVAAIQGNASESASASAALPAVAAEAPHSPAAAAAIAKEEPSFLRTSVVAAGPAGASRSTTEPATAPAEGANEREADPAVAPVATPAENAPHGENPSRVENAPHVELARREEELAALPDDAPPFQRDLLKSRIQDLRSQAASTATQQTNRAGHETVPAQEAGNSGQPNTFTNAGTPSAATHHQEPQRTALEPSAVRSSIEASPTASPAPFSGKDPAQEWEGVQKSDVGRTIETRNGKRGVITDVGRYTVRFRREDGSFDASHRQNARVVSHSNLGTEIPSRAMFGGAVAEEQSLPDSANDREEVQSDFPDGREETPLDESNEIDPAQLPQSVAELSVALEAADAWWDRQAKEIESKLHEPAISSPEKHALHKKRRNLQAKRQQHARALAAIPAAQRGKVRVLNAIPPELAHVVSDGLDIVSRYTHRNLLPAVAFHKIPKWNRATESHGDVMVPIGVDASSVAHEVTHATEKQNPQVLAAARAFLASRTVGETPKPLAVLTGNPKYGADEFALEDQWKTRGGTHYSGKVYPSSTELITVGIERLHQDPLRFLRDDPEYFSFIVKTLRQW